MLKELLADVVRAIALLIFAAFKGFLSITRWFLRSSQVRSSAPRNANAVPARATRSNGRLAQLWKRVLKDQASANALALWLLVGILSFMFVFKDKLHIWERILDDPWQRAFATVLFVAIAVMVISAVRNGLDKDGVKYSPEWRKRIIWGVPIVFAIAVLALLSTNEKELENIASAQNSISPATAQVTTDTTSAPHAPTQPTVTHPEPTPQETPRISFLAPAGGETLIHNHVFEFRWNAEHLPKDTLLDLFLVRVGQTHDVYQGLGGVSNSGSYLWLVWDAMEPGPYRLRITMGFDNVLAESEIFNIIR